jgi:hypothetical protein
MEELIVRASDSLVHAPLSGCRSFWELFARQLREFRFHAAVDPLLFDTWLFVLERHTIYDPGWDLEEIQAQLLTINSADDLINPPEFGILEREIKRVSHGRANRDSFERQNARPCPPCTCCIVER